MSEHGQPKFTPEELEAHQEFIEGQKAISALEEQVEYERNTAKMMIIGYSLTTLIALSGLLYIGYEKLVKPNINSPTITNTK
ncbi:MULTISPECIES: hypothetical protein [Calothrix]|uniref:Uncharacterized protein n=2 Tax=Calothrix TaxID=1186 RepID=A0ABR8AC55_9CYAN|nr:MULTISPECIES: hypothetical protein [Calothrix]MBD2196601.1 hypothetical protein [Calothrix parietina FACHB-288]MBD2228034.1 hypothetical protein [Calothrix anomala FACHB-343]